MADVAAHAALGGAVMSLLATDKTTKFEYTAYGVIFGAWPDAVPRLLSSFGADRWELYNVYHHSWSWMDLIGNIPFILHKLSDIPFHPYPGYNWGTSPWLIALDVVYWLIAAAIFWYSFTRRLT